MEELAGLYRSLGLPLGAEFSSEDVGLIYRQVFHVPSSTADACAAMQKFAGTDSSWSCVGENLLDVLLEMEREREKKEKLYWEIQLQLNVGNVNAPSEAASPVIGSGRIHRVDSQTRESQKQRVLAKKDPPGGVSSVKRLQKSARQFWARLASEGLYSIVCQGQGPGVRGQAWGRVSLPDVLFLVDVKYDVVAQLLYQEMLQEHHTSSIWEGMLPWQQQKEEEELEDLAEEALESGNVAGLAELPGAFRTYSVCTGASSRGRLEQCCSAVSLLWELHAFRQREKDALTKLTESLDSGGLRLLCLYIRLATARAQRDTLSYSALLSARQSWETWPRVRSPCKAEQATLWLRRDSEEPKTGLVSGSPQQAVLQLLVMNQEQERKQLLCLLRGVSLEDLQEPDSDSLIKEDHQERAAFRNVWIKKLKSIYRDTQRRVQRPAAPHAHDVGAETTAEIRSQQQQQQLEDCCLVLLIQQSELEEEEDSEVLLALEASRQADECAERVQTLRDRYESQLRTRSSSQTSDQSSAEAPNRSCGPAEDPSSSRPKTGATGDETKEENICTGCGVIIEVLPYLEVLCVSDEPSEGLAAEEDGCAVPCPRDHENQSSLITLAWGKPPEERGDRAAEVAGVTRDGLDTQFQSSDLSSRGEEGLFEDGDDADPTLVRAESVGHLERLRVDEQRGTFPQGGDAPGCDLQGYGDTLQAAPSRLLGHSTETRAGDLICGLTSEGEDPETEQAGAERLERWPPAPLPGCPVSDPTHTEDYNPDVQGGCRAAEGRSKETEGGGTSAVDRERTMRNLVDVQRKVERRHRRDRERQRLRVQERLTIVQSRKAEGDPLGGRRADGPTGAAQKLPQEDKHQQQTAVRERVERLRRERSCVVQSKRDRNTAGFKELLGPEALRGSETDDGTKGAAAHLHDSLKLF